MEIHRLWDGTFHKFAVSAMWPANLDLEKLLS